MGYNAATRREVWNVNTALVAGTPGIARLQDWQTLDVQYSDLNHNE